MAAVVVTVAAGCVQVVGFNLAQVVDWITGAPSSPLATGQAASGPAAMTPAPSVTDTSVTTLATIQTPPQPTTKPGPVTFTFDQRTEVKSCDDLTGHGDPPATGKAAMFVRYEPDESWYYEQPVEFGPNHTWVSNDVHTGVEADGGKNFVYGVVAVTNETAAFLNTKDGTEYKVKELPGDPMAISSPMVRTNGLSAC